VEISDIVGAIQSGRVRITDHADEEADSDGLAFEEVYYSVMHGEIIESYPTDKPFPSCLIFGRTFSGDPIHSVWAHNEYSGWVALITVYRPDPERWIDWRERRGEQ
jgi:hypothetical protein